MKRATTEPLVLVSVHGGVADVDTVRGNADIFFVDWDNVEAYDPDDTRELLEDARKRLAGIPSAAWIITNLAQELERQIAAQRASDEWADELRQRDLDHARELLREAGELP